MIRINEAADGRRIADRAGVTFEPGPDQVVAREDARGRLLGGVVFKKFTRASVEMHIAGFDKGWINRTLLWVSFDYPFTQLGCSKVFGPIAASNRPAIELAEKIGFTLETTIGGVFVSGDLHIYSMRREDCRWLGLTGLSVWPGG